MFKMLRWCSLDSLLLPFRIAPRGERECSLWLTLLACLGCPIVHYYIISPFTYFALHTFVCDAGYGAGSHTFYSVSMQADPLLAGFPCRNLSSKPHPLETNALRLTSTIPLQPAEQMAWISERWWWIHLYVQGWHTLPILGGMVLAVPASYILPLFFTEWWVGGGRTLLKLSCRVLASLSQLYLHTLCKQQCAHPYAHVDMYTFAVHNMLARMVIGVVQWRIQVPLSIFEMVVFVLAMLSEVRFVPPSPWWLVQLLSGTVSGTAMGLLTAYMVHYFWLHFCTVNAVAESKYTEPAGPLNAVRVMVSGGVQVVKDLNDSLGTVQLVVQVLGLVGCVLFLTFWEGPGILPLV